MKSQAKGLRRIINATKYSLAGLKAAWKNEAAFRLEITASAVMIPAAFYISRSSMELVVLVATLLIVLITELVNSAVEAIVDRIGEDYHELSERAKDIGSAAVFVSLLLVSFVWGVILLDRCREGCKYIGKILPS